MPPKSPDPAHFELVETLRKGSRNSSIVAGVCALVALTSVASQFIQANRPIPVVVRGASLHEPSQVVLAGGAGTEIRELDAKQFMLKSGELLHGWDSADVVKKLTAVSYMMTAKWRKSFTDEVQKVIEVPAEVAPEGKESVLGYYVSLRVRNVLDWNFESIKCERNAEQKSWGCYGRVVVETQPLIGDPLTNPPRKELIIRARFNEVEVTKNTIDGLLIDFWDQRDANAPAAPATPATP
jgi:hypothetical protein